MEFRYRIPFTPTQGYYPGIDFLDPNGNPDINFDYTTANGDPSVLYGTLNSNRLPVYHRFDASLKYSAPTKYGSFECTIGATNIYNRENIFYYDRVAAERINQLPIMPTISTSLAFNWRRKRYFCPVLIRTMASTKYIFVTGGVTSSLGKELSQRPLQNYCRQGLQGDYPKNWIHTST